MPSKRVACIECVNEGVSRSFIHTLPDGERIEYRRVFLRYAGGIDFDIECRVLPTAWRSTMAGTSSVIRT